jgi:hypothetical protein
MPTTNCVLDVNFKVEGLAPQNNENLGQARLQCNQNRFIYEKFLMQT